MSYVNLPKKTGYEVYRVCEEEFVETARKYADILAVYSGGTVKHPGISDLDFIVFLKNQLSVRMDIENRLPQKVVKMLKGGTILKINERNIRDIQIIDPLPLKHLYGDKYVFRRYDGTTFSICRILDWLPERIFSLWQYVSQDRRDVSRGLLLLKSLTVSLDLVDQLKGDGAYAAYHEEVHSLRRLWFVSEKSLENFNILLKRGMCLAQEALDSISLWLVDQKYISGSPEFIKGAVFDIPSGPTFHFDQKTHIVRSRLYIPWVVAIFLAQQAQSGKGYLSMRLKKSFDTIIDANQYDINWAFANTITKRIAYVESLIKFFHDNGLSRGLLKYGWYLKD
ncbi:MAG: hypothetical protein Q8P73_01240 [bacterium]|nr:hypothetical protein [bacterium]